MRTKLLKQLRSEAKSHVYLIPISGDTNRCVICHTKSVSSKYGSHCWDIEYTYYFQCNGENDWAHHIPQEIRLKNQKYPFQPYTFNQALIRLKEIRKWYIMNKIHEMRLTWKNKQETFRTWIFQLTKL